MQNLREIRFFRPYGEYGFLSNFFVSPVIIDGKEWATVEHYFQAAKFKNAPLYQLKIRRASTPNEAKILGGTRAIPIILNWDDERLTTMRIAHKAKFTQHSDLLTKLLETYGAILIEANTHDPFWGVGHNGLGKNMQGKLLMELRDSYF